MTKEEAIKYLKEMKDECNDTFHKVRYVTQEEALDMAIKALEQEPTKEEQALLQKWRDNRGISIEDFEDAMNALQEPSGDVISRQAVIELINNSALNLGYENANNMMQDNILSLPSVQPKTKTGCWIERGDDRFDWLECSECGYGDEGEVKWGEGTRFCPNCGAKMEGEDE